MASRFICHALFLTCYWGLCVCVCVCVWRECCLAQEVGTAVAVSTSPPTAPPKAVRSAPGQGVLGLNGDGARGRQADVTGCPLSPARSWRLRRYSGFEWVGMFVCVGVCVRDSVIACCSVIAFTHHKRIGCMQFRLKYIEIADGE